MLTGMRMLILGQLYQNIRSLASFGVIKICGVLFRWSLSGVLKWQQSALLSCVCVSGVAGARLAMLPNERRASVRVHDGWRNRDRRDKKERGSRSSSIVGAERWILN